MDSQCLKTLSHLWATGNSETLTASRLRLRRRQNDSYWFMSAPKAVAPCSPRSFSLSLLFCVFCPICRGRWWPGCRQPWQMAVLCARMCAFVFHFFFLRGVSAGRDRFSAIVLPPQLIQRDPLGWRARCSICPEFIHMHETHKDNRHEMCAKCIIIPLH